MQGVLNYAEAVTNSENDLLSGSYRNNLEESQIDLYFSLSILSLLPRSVNFLSFFLFFEMEFCSCCPGWSAMVRSRLITTFAS